MVTRLARSTLFPYTTLFRSAVRAEPRVERPVVEARVVGEPRRRRVVGHLADDRSEEHTSELQSPYDLVCRLLLEKKQLTPFDSLIIHAELYCGLACAYLKPT